jgi:hypothetical protein
MKLLNKDDARLIFVILICNISRYFRFKRREQFPGRITWRGTNNTSRELGGRLSAMTVLQQFDGNTSLPDDHEQSDHSEFEVQNLPSSRFNTQIFPKTVSKHVIDLSLLCHAWHIAR